MGNEFKKTEAMFNLFLKANRQENQGPKGPKKPMPAKN